MGIAFSSCQFDPFCLGRAPTALVKHIHHFVQLLFGYPLNLEKNRNEQLAQNGNNKITKETQNRKRKNINKSRETKSTAPWELCRLLDLCSLSPCQLSLALVPIWGVCEPHLLLLLLLAPEHGNSNLNLCLYGARYCIKELHKSTRQPKGKSLSERFWLLQ